MSRQAADSLPAGSARRAASGDCGFTILEALIATGIVTLIAFTGLAACKAMAQVMLWSSGARHSAASVDTQAAQLRNDAASAFAVFAPESDMYGRMNDGQELDFYSKADDGRPILWRYFYAAAAQTLQRWDFDPTGARGVRDAKTGVIDAAATYPPLNGITHFRATAISADRLGDPAYNIYSGIGALFTRPPRALPVRYAAVPGGSAAVGGNGVMQVSLTSQAAARVLDLAAGSCWVPRARVMCSSMLASTFRTIIGPARSRGAISTCSAIPTDSIRTIRMRITSRTNRSNAARTSSRRAGSVTRCRRHGIPRTIRPTRIPSVRRCADRRLRARRCSFRSSSSSRF